MRLKLILFFSSFIASCTFIIFSSKYVQVQEIGVSPPVPLHDYPFLQVNQKGWVEERTVTKQVQLLSDRDVALFMAKYTQLHNEITTGSKPARYVIFKKNSAWGWGNHVLGVLSTLLFAIVTERAILIDDSQLVGPAINWPFKWKFSAHTDFNAIHKPTPYQLQNDACFLDLPESMGEVLENRDLNDTYPDPVMSLEINCPAFHWIARNPLYKDILREHRLLPSNVPLEEYGFYVAASLSKIFFAELDHKYQKLAVKALDRWKKDDKDTFIIGIQVRKPFLHPNETQLFWDCAEKLAAKHSSVKYYIATESPGIQEHASQFFANETVDISLELEQIYSETEREYAELVLENYMLGECDEIIVTPRSTYGAVAALRTGKLPVSISPDWCKLVDPTKGPIGSLENSVLW